jgi:hypothetical protein
MSIIELAAGKGQREIILSNIYASTRHTPLGSRRLIL